MENNEPARLEDSPTSLTEEQGARLHYLIDQSFLRQLTDAEREEMVTLEMVRNEEKAQWLRLVVGDHRLWSEGPFGRHSAQPIWKDAERPRSIEVYCVRRVRTIEELREQQKAYRESREQRAKAGYGKSVSGLFAGKVVVDE